jgi:hypothetical protein
MGDSINLFDFEKERNKKEIANKFMTLLGCKKREIVQRNG